MKTIITAICLISILVSGCKRASVSDTRNDREKMNLRGDIRYVEETSDSTQIQSQFDDKGNLTAQIVTNHKTGIEDGFILNIYDHEGRLTTQNKSIPFKEMMKDFPVWNGQAVDLPRQNIRYVFTYEKNGLIKELEDFYDKGKSLLVSYQYNDNDQLTKKESADKNYSVDYEYDPEGYLIRTIETKKGKQPLTTLYDKEENIAVSPDGWEFTYDTQRHCIMKKKGNQQITYKYNLRGDEIEQNSINLNIKTISKYTYDADSNWVKREVTFPSLPGKTQTIKRSIITSTLGKLLVNDMTNLKGTWEALQNDNNQSEKIFIKLDLEHASVCDDFGKNMLGTISRESVNKKGENQIINSYYIYYVHPYGTTYTIRFMKYGPHATTGNIEGNYQAVLMYNTKNEFFFLKDIKPALGGIIPCDIKSQEFRKMEY